MDTGGGMRNYSAAGGGMSQQSLAKLNMGVGVVSAAASAYSTYVTAKANKKLFEAQAFANEVNARISEKMAEDAIARGHEREGISRQKTKKTRGSQRASLAAQGIRVDTGSALDVQLETEDIGEINAVTIRNNALREAFGHHSQAANYMTQAGLDRIRGAQEKARGISKAGQTLLTGGTKFIGKYQRYNKEYGNA